MVRNKYRKILVTGGAGFIGSFLVDRLIGDGYQVKVLDNLEKQVHNGKKPKYLNRKAEFIKGDIRNYSTLKKAFKEIDIIFHLAASVGVCQSNYQVKKYIGTNIGGTANLLELLINTKHRVKKIITMSSMTGYGEGNYKCRKCKIVRPYIREEGQLKKKDWNIYCPNCKKAVSPIPTGEEALDFPSSIYGLSKKAQQDMVLITGKLYKIPTVVLRGFNIYGPRQSLSNPYTGVTAVFISRLKNNRPIIIFEDGLQTRDFVSVHDVIQALVLSLESEKANYQMFNIGSGEPVTIKRIAMILKPLLNKNGKIIISGEYRKNDIRHCFANITKAKELLKWKPQIKLEEGLKELVAWSWNKKSEDKFELAKKELKLRRVI